MDSSCAAYESGVLLTLGMACLGVSLTFIFILRFASVGSRIQVKEVSEGWLNAVEDRSSEKISIPTGLRIELQKIDSKREYFQIAEGFYKGRKASVKLNDEGNSWFTAVNPHLTTAKLTYSKSKKLLTINGMAFKTQDDPSMPWDTGIYDIEMPDYPHKGGRRYPNAKYGTTWFKIGHGGDRYLHLNP
jgi:hypothetical protein